MNENSHPRGRIISAIVAGIALGSALNAAADTLLIENVTLIDGTGRPPVAGASVLINDDRIQEISRGSIETSTEHESNRWQRQLPDTGPDGFAHSLARRR